MNDFENVKKRLFYNRCSACQTFSMELRSDFLRKTRSYQLISFIHSQICAKKAITALYLLIVNEIG